MYVYPEPALEYNFIFNFIVDHSAFVYSSGHFVPETFIITIVALSGVGEWCVCVLIFYHSLALCQPKRYYFNHPMLLSHIKLWFPSASPLEAFKRGTHTLWKNEKKTDTNFLFLFHILQPFGLSRLVCRNPHSFSSLTPVELSQRRRRQLKQ